MVRRQSLEENWRRVISQVHDATLVAVSKTKPIQDIQILLQLGQRHFGENRVSELLEKGQELINEQVEWHFIGHLQTNKVKSLLACPHLKYIHSIDSLKLLNEIFKHEG